MRKNWLIDRRTCLKGLGVALGLPLLETMGWAETPKSGGYKIPVRLGWMFMPCGVNRDKFWPKDEKSWAASLSPTLEPLRPLFDDILLLDGINGPRGGPSHATELCGWLTASSPNKQRPDQIDIAISADQLAAAHLGLQTALPSLELGCKESKSGSEARQEGLTNIYYQTASFRSPTQPLPMEVKPAEVYKRIFSSRQSTPKKKVGAAPAAGGAASAGAVNTAQFSAADEEGSTLDRSMLDLVRESAGDLRKQVSADDQRQLDDYLDSVRSLEKRVAAIERQQAEAAQAAKAGKSGKAGAASVPRSPPIEVKVPGGDLKWSENVRLMGDLLILAFQTDTTRVGTLVTAHDHGVHYWEVGASTHHHPLSHHENKKDTLEEIAKIDRFNIEQYAYIVQRMKGLKEGPGSLLDNVIFTWNNGLGDGQTHSHERLPTIIAGKGGGTIRTGRYVPKANGNSGDLLMGVMARAGVPVPKTFGIGTKLLPDLS
jgi:Protein of unknown function (DUF1552)